MKLILSTLFVVAGLLSQAQAKDVFTLSDLEGTWHAYNWNYGANVGFPSGWSPEGVSLRVLWNIDSSTKSIRIAAECTSLKSKAQMMAVSEPVAISIDSKVIKVPTVPMVSNVKSTSGCQIAKQLPMEYSYKFGANKGLLTVWRFPTMPTYLCKLKVGSKTEASEECKADIKAMKQARK